MDLKEQSKIISDRFNSYKEEAFQERDNIRKGIETTTIELKDAAAKGDLSENAAYTSAVEALSGLQARLANINERIKEAEKVVDEEYVPIGMIVDYTTVQLSANGKKHVYKLYPGDTSDIEKGILSIESPLGKAIYLKGAGDTVVIEHKITGDPVEFKIEAIY